MSGWAPWALKPHGTLAAYRRHNRRGEKPCRPCREAHNAYNREWMRARRRAEAEAFWRARDEAAEAAYQASAEAWRAEHEASVQRQHERAVRTLVALLAEACDAA